MHDNLLKNFGLDQTSQISWLAFGISSYIFKEWSNPGLIHVDKHIIDTSNAIPIKFSLRRAAFDFEANSQSPGSAKACPLPSFHFC